MMRFEEGAAHGSSTISSPQRPLIITSAEWWRVEGKTFTITLVTLKDSHHFHTHLSMPLTPCTKHCRGLITFISWTRHTELVHLAMILSNKFTFHTKSKNMAPVLRSLRTVSSVSRLNSCVLPKHDNIGGVSPPKRLVRSASRRWPKRNIPSFTDTLRRLDTGCDLINSFEVGATKWQIHACRSESWRQAIKSITSFQVGVHHELEDHSVLLMTHSRASPALIDLGWAFIYCPSKSMRGSHSTALQLASNKKKKFNQTTTKHPRSHSNPGKLKATIR